MVFYKCVNTLIWSSDIILIISVGILSGPADSLYLPKFIAYIISVLLLCLALNYVLRGCSCHILLYHVVFNSMYLCSDIFFYGVVLVHIFILSLSNLLIPFNCNISSVTHGVFVPLGFFSVLFFLKSAHLLCLLFFFIFFERTLWLLDCDLKYCWNAFTK